MIDRRLHLASDEIVVDLFCGGGGATQGIEDAGLAVAECVNHCPTAIDTHARNHPATNHRQGDVWKNEPRVVAAGRPVGLLWASPDCRHFSRARGAAPVSRRVRDLAWVVTRWAEDVRPRVIIVENVPELVTWGPIRSRRDAQGRPVKDAQGRAVMEPTPERKGETFARWVRRLRMAGYTVEWRVLDAADYGAASRRKRLYVIARCDGAAIEWPEVTHGQSNTRNEVEGRGRSVSVAIPIPSNQATQSNSGGVSTRSVGDSRSDGTVCRTRRSAAEVIDWTDLGTSIFDRRRFLAEKTLSRIAEGLRRYVIADPRPFVLRVTQTGDRSGWHVTDSDAPMPTQTTRQDLAVVSPVLQAFRGNAAPHPVSEPTPAITAGNGPGRGAGAGHALGVISPLMLVNRTHCLATPVSDPINTVATGGHHGLIAPVLATTGYGERQGQRPRCSGVNALLGTCVDGVKQGLVSPLLMSAGGPECNAVPADRPMGTVLTRDHRAAAAAVLVAFYGSESGGRTIDDAMGTVTTRDRHALSTGVLVSAVQAAEMLLSRARRCATLMWYFAGVEPGPDGLVWVEAEGERRLLVDILFRMLKPRELAAAMGFPASYVWPRTQRDAVRLIGNAVSPPQAAALVRAVLPGGRERREGVA